MPTTLQERAAELKWYHTIQLPDGVLTAGYVDTRAAAARLPIPALDGKRCLDIGTMNGFWAFEMERRGAAEIVTIDVDDLREIDWPARTRLLDPDGGYINPEDRHNALGAFELARDALSSKVQRRAVNVYGLADSIEEKFDFVFVGSILLHLRDPVRALENAREVCRGEAVIFEAIDLVGTALSPRSPRASLDGTRVWWWTPNLAALKRMIESAGWEVIERTPMLFVPSGAGFRTLTLKGVLRSGPNAMVAALKGFPHVGWRVRPVA